MTSLIGDIDIESISYMYTISLYRGGIAEIKVHKENRFGKFKQTIKPDSVAYERVMRDIRSAAQSEAIWPIKFWSLVVAKDLDRLRASIRTSR
jgi:hypothetical protein